MFKKLAFISAAALFVLGSVQGAEKSKVRMEKFYGKITAVNVQSQTLTAFNKAKKMESSFKINGETRVVLKKVDQSLNQLEVGQNVIVYFTGEDATPLARRITIRSRQPKQT